MLSLHIALFLINDILLVVLKKASDRYASSKCYSQCCANPCGCIMDYVEKEKKPSSKGKDSIP